MSRAFTVGNIVFGLLFIVSALLQLNDPDPWRWVALWFAAGVACLLHRRAWWAAWIVALVALAWAARLAPTAVPTFEVRDLAKSMHADTPAIETSRELLGLLIIAGWMIVVTVVGGRRRSG